MPLTFTGGVLVFMRAAPHDRPGDRFPDSCCSAERRALDAWHLLESVQTEGPALAYGPHLN